MYSDFDPEEVELESYEDDYRLNEEEKGPFIDE